MNYNLYRGPYEERGFWMPLLVGGLGGYAIGNAAARPRPVYVNRPSNPYPMPYMGSYGYSNYNYYY